MDDKELLGELGRRVKARRELMALSQADLAVRGGPGEATVSRLERGDGAAPRRQTQQQLEKALALPPGTVREFLDTHRRTLAEGPNLVATRVHPLGGTAVQVLDESLAHELQNELGFAAGPGRPLDLSDVDDDGSAARRALLIAGRTPPAYPVALVHLPSAREYRAESPSELYNLIATGDYRLKHAVPGLNIKVYDPGTPNDAEPPAQIITAAGTPSTSTAGQPTITQHPPRAPRNERTRINLDGTVERSPLMPLAWRVVGDLGDQGAALAQALEVVRDLPPTDNVVRTIYHLSQVLQELADQIDDVPAS